MIPRRLRRSAAWRLPLLVFVAVFTVTLAVGYTAAERGLPVGNTPAAQPPLVDLQPQIPPLPAPPATLEPARQVPPVFEEPVVDLALLALQEEMQAVVDGYWVNGNFAVAISDLQSGQTISVYGDRTQVAGCIWNLSVIIVALRDVQAGRYPLSDVEAIIRQTIWASDASAALKLYRIVGDGDYTGGVQRVLDLARDGMALVVSVIDHPPAFTDFSLDISDTNLITANEVNQLLSALYHGELLNSEWTAWLLDAMTRVKPGLNYLTAFGTGGKVSHKNGFLPENGTWVDNDAGIVRFERGGQEYAYAITFLSEGVPAKYADIPLGQRLSQLAWSHFDAAY